MSISLGDNVKSWKHVIVGPKVVSVAETTEQLNLKVVGKDNQDKILAVQASIRDLDIYVTTNPTTSATIGMKKLQYFRKREYKQ